MELLRCRTRLAVLWIIKAIGYSAFLFLGFMEPGGIETITSGKTPAGMQITGGTLFVMGLFWWIPWIMAWLSMTLKGSANRWTNFVMGIVFALVLIFAMSTGQSSSPMLVDYILGILVSLLIAWYAWKLPKEEA
jgi:hypothetical protein